MEAQVLFLEQRVTLSSSQTAPSRKTFNKKTVDQLINVRRPIHDGVTQRCTTVSLPQVRTGAVAMRRRSVQPSRRPETRHAGFAHYQSASQKTHKCLTANIRIGPSSTLLGITITHIALGQGEDITCYTRSYGPSPHGRPKVRCPTDVQLSILGKLLFSGLFPFSFARSR